MAIEPAESPVLSGGPSGAHKIEGTGAGFVVPLWRPEAADEIAAVSTEEAMAMCRRLAAEEAIFAGTSTGGNVVKAIELGRRLGPRRDRGDDHVRHRLEVPLDGRLRNPVMLSHPG